MKPRNFRDSIGKDFGDRVEFFQYDTIDHEKMGVGSEEITRRVDIGIDLFLMCHGDLLDAPVDDWNIGFDIEGDDYCVDVGEVNPDYEELCVFLPQRIRKAQK